MNTVEQALKDMNASVLLRGFTVKDAGTDLHLFCKHCTKAWALVKGSKGVGNILHLLNHQVGHERKEN